MTPSVRQISQRLSLRAPQQESLEILDRACALIPLSKGTDSAAALHAIQSEFPHVTSFDRDFPSLCFALATGVGKTRLMGAFIAYLYRTRGLRHFLILAPNLTIYKKLIQDFTPNTKKYVFQGIADFAITPPVLITGESYDRVRLVQEQQGQAAIWDTREAHINIFNISKITTKEGRKVTRLRETLGESYFGYLSELEDLVVLMDESHRYRAKAGAQAINALKPILGLELTATPRVETGGGREFENVIYRFDLAAALDAGFVKEPAVGTRENFSAANYSPEALEKLKLEDGIRMHADTKVQLETYALQTGAKRVKPFVLVIARDTAHAEDLRKRIEAPDFFGGQYAGKVIVVHSNQTGEEADDTVEKLLNVEDPANPTEIVVHVNMLKEGWDVTNLYTVIPLRTASSKTLVEQSIGRGLRLPYGKRTGVEAVDRLTIVAHDRFQEIVDYARSPDSPLRRAMAIRLTPLAPTQVETVEPTVVTRIVTAEMPAPERKAAEATLEVIREFETLKSSAELSKPEQQEKLVNRVRAVLAAQPAQPHLPGATVEPPIPVDLAAIVARTTARFQDLTIDIPRITVTPIDGRAGYIDFNLDLRTVAYQPSPDAIYIQNLHDGKGSTLSSWDTGDAEREPEHYLVRSLIDYPDIGYDSTAELLYKLAGQTVAHLRGYLPDEEAVHNVVRGFGKQLVSLIHAQMQEHFEETASGYHVNVSKGFTPLRADHYPVAAAEPMRDFRDPVANKQGIRQLLFGGFEKCLYGKQRFDVDAERLLSVVLEKDSDVLKWYKPGRNDFQIYYSQESAYEPDFVVETRTGKFLCEPKRTADLNDKQVQDKARAARRWCERASTVGDKPWKYLLIPHDWIQENKTFSFFAANCASAQTV
jgi:type III restriction enzyme